MGSAATPHAKGRDQAGLICGLLAIAAKSPALEPPVLTWVTNSSVKVEQLIGDLDWAALARGTNLPTASQTISRFNIVGTDVGSPVEYGSKLLILFGDTIGSNVNYHAADTLAWSTNNDGESGLRLNFYNTARMETCSSSLRASRWARTMSQIPGSWYRM